MSGAGVVRGPAPRRPLWLQGLGPAAVAAVLLLLSLLGPVPVLLGVAVLQLVLALGVLVLLDAPSSGAAFGLAVVAAAAGDASVLGSDGSVDALAGVLALSLVAALLLQIARKDRARVTESLAHTLLAVLLVAAAACLIAVRDRPGGDAALLVGLAAAGTALLVARLVDLVNSKPLLVPGASRGWAGMVLGLATGAVVAAVVAGAGDAVTGGQGALIGLAVTATALAADLAADLSAVTLRNGPGDSRRVRALTPVAFLLPYAALAPVLLLAASLVQPSS